MNQSLSLEGKLSLESSQRGLIHLPLPVDDVMMGLRGQESAIGDLMEEVCRCQLYLPGGLQWSQVLSPLLAL